MQYLVNHQKAVNKVLIVKFVMIYLKNGHN